METRVRVFGGVKLPASLGDDPAPGSAIDREDGPALAILVAEMHEERLSIVLDSQPMGGVALLAEDARLVFLRVS